jgi:hypothetical protein
MIDVCLGGELGYAELGRDFAMLRYWEGIWKSGGLVFLLSGVFCCQEVVCCHTLTSFCLKCQCL